MKRLAFKALHYQTATMFIEYTDHKYTTFRQMFYIPCCTLAGIKIGIKLNHGWRHLEYLIINIASIIFYFLKMKSETFTSGW